MEEVKKCPKCREEINKKATRCPKCHADLRNWFNRHPIITIFLALIFVSAIINNALNISNPSNVTNTNNNKTSDIPIENWQYFDEVDEMDWTKILFASTVSSNKIDLSFPYWTTSAVLTLRKKWNNKSEVVFSVEKWQILDYNKKARIKFDDWESISVNITGSSSRKPNVVFLRSEDLIISKLKTAKTVMIEVEYYQDWMQISKFNVDWLNFD